MRLRFAAGFVLGLAAPAVAQNLVPDPAFTQGLGIWSNIYVLGTYTMTWVPSPSVRPGSGSARLNFDGPAGNGAWSLEHPGLGRTLVRLGLLDPLSGRDADDRTERGLFRLRRTRNARGIRSGIVLPISPMQVNAWITRVPLSFTAPAGSQSFFMSFVALGVPGAKATAYVDDIYLAQSGTVPPIICSPQSRPFRRSGSSRSGPRWRSPGGFCSAPDAAASVTGAPETRYLPDRCGAG